MKINFYDLINKMTSPYSIKAWFSYMQTNLTNSRKKLTIDSSQLQAPYFSACDPIFQIYNFHTPAHFVTS